MCSVYVDAGFPHRVSPFGYLRIVAHLQLPEAFRSLSRPSSAPDAKAFPLRSFMLDLRRGILRIACPAAWLNAPRRKCAHAAASPLKFRPAALGSEFVHSVPASRADLSGSNLLRVVQSLGSLSIRIMQTHLFYQQNCNYPFLPSEFLLQAINVSLLLPSHNLHQMSQCSVFKVHLELALIEIFFSEYFNQHISFRKMVGQSGLEPPTSRLSVVCSSQLSYWPIFFRSPGALASPYSPFLVEISGFEPLTSCLQGRRSPS